MSKTSFVTLVENGDSSSETCFKSNQGFQVGSFFLSYLDQVDSQGKLEA